MSTEKHCARKINKINGLKANELIHVEKQACNMVKFVFFIQKSWIIKPLSIDIVTVAWIQYEIFFQATQVVK